LSIRSKALGLEPLVGHDGVLGGHLLLVDLLGLALPLLALDDAPLCGDATSGLDRLDGDELELWHVVVVTRLVVFGDEIERRPGVAEGEDLGRGRLQLGGLGVDRVRQQLDRLAHVDGVAVVDLVRVHGQVHGRRWPGELLRDVLGGGRTESGHLAGWGSALVVVSARSGACRGSTERRVEECRSRADYHCCPAPQLSWTGNVSENHASVEMIVIHVVVGPPGGLGARPGRYHVREHRNGGGGRHADECKSQTE